MSNQNVPPLYDLGEATQKRLKAKSIQEAIVLSLLVLGGGTFVNMFWCGMSNAFGSDLCNMVGFWWVEWAIIGIVVLQWAVITACNFKAPAFFACGLAAPILLMVAIANLYGPASEAIQRQHDGRRIAKYYISTFGSLPPGFDQSAVSDRKYFGLGVICHASFDTVDKFMATHLSSKWKHGGPGYYWTDDGKSGASKDFKLVQQDNECFLAMSP